MSPGPTAPNKAVEPTAPMAALWHAGAVHGAAAHRERSASNSRLSWGEQAHNILSQYQASYQAILDIATYLSLNKLFGFNGKQKVGMRLAEGDDHVV